MQEIPLGGQRRLCPREVHGGVACGLKPTEFGGLGVSDLKLQGYALQARWLWLQKTDSDRAWSELPIKTAPEVQAFFRASTFYRVGDGRTALF